MPALDFELLFAALPVPHAVLDPAGTILALNASCSLLFKGTDLVGQPLAALLAAGVAADLGLEPEAAWESVLAGARAGQTGVLNPRPRGSSPDAPGQYWQATVQPVPVAPDPRYLLIRLFDVTEQVRIRERGSVLAREMYRRDQQLRTITDSLPLITYASSPDGASTEYLSPQWFAYTGQEPATYDPKTTWWEAVYPDDRERVTATFGQALSQGQAWNSELRLRRHDGQYRWFLTRAVPEHGADGCIVRWFGSSTDIHDQYELREQLERKDQFLQRMLQAMPAHVSTLEGADYCLTFFTPALGQLFHGRLQLGQPLAEAVPEAIAQGLMALMDQVHETGQPFDAHEQAVTLRHPETGEPEVRYFDLSLQLLPPLPGHRHARPGILLFAVDMTRQVLVRRQAEALETQLHQQSHRLRTMTEALPQITFISTPTGGVEYLSPQWAAYTRQAATEQGSRWIEHVHPDDRPVVDQHFAAARRLGDQWSYELRLRRHDGQYRWHLSRGVPELDDQGRVLRWYGSDTDIHELRELQDELRFLSESVPQIVWTANAQGENTFVNRRWVAYTGIEKFTSVVQALHPDDCSITFERWGQALATGGFFEVEYRLRSRSGEYRWFLGQAQALRDEQGQVLKWFGTCTDIHDMKLGQQRLEEQNRQLRRINSDLDQFVYTASHDLRQPIHNMAGIFEELTRTAYFRDPDAVKLITMFERALQQIYDTIEDLGAIVQVQRRSEPVPLEPVALQPLAQEVLASVQDLVQARGATLELDFTACPVLPYVRTNLQSILFNLISNSLKYAAPDRPPRIRLCCAPDPAAGHPVLTVEDNGLGLDLSRHGEELFQLFRRFHPDVEGSGVGLYLVNRIVQSNGGRIEVQSTVGEGTTFLIHFAPPRLASPAPEPPAVDPAILESFSPEQEEFFAG